jgi:enamine deaminase RidA (YjgF/YER057c/UK114 family)
VSVTKYLIDIERDNAVVAEETVAHLPHLPTSTTVEIARFVPPDLRLEVSAVAVVRPPSH